MGELFGRCAGKDLVDGVVTESASEFAEQRLDLVYYAEWKYEALAVCLDQPDEVCGLFRIGSCSEDCQLDHAAENVRQGGDLVSGEFGLGRRRQAPVEVCATVDIAALPNPDMAFIAVPSARPGLVRESDDGREPGIAVKLTPVMSAGVDDDRTRQTTGEALRGKWDDGASAGQPDQVFSAAWMEGIMASR